MKSHLLFPRYFRPIGFLLAIPGLVLGYLFLFERYSIPGFGPPPILNNISGRFDTYTNELALALVILGLLFIAFSKVKREDELTALMRLNALYWAILANYLVIFAWSILVQFTNMGNNDRVLDLNLIMPLIIFVLRFYYLLYKNKDEYYIPALHFLPYRPFNKIGKGVSIIFMAIFIFSVIIELSKQWDSIPSKLSDYINVSYYISPYIYLIWIYSKERKEDEYVNSIRLTAMQIAIYVNYAILLVTNFFVYGLSFFVVEVLNFSTMPLIFIIVFQYRLYQLSKQSDEKNSSSINLNIL